jgi:hypothetical protein
LILSTYLQINTGILKLLYTSLAPEAAALVLNVDSIMPDYRMLVKGVIEHYYNKRLPLLRMYTS